MKPLLSERFGTEMIVFVAGAFALLVASGAATLAAFIGFGLVILAALAAPAVFQALGRLRGAFWNTRTA